MPRDPLTGVILVVDDRENVRDVLRRQLQEFRHTVLEAVDGVEALHLVRRRNGAVDLILSGVAMPRMKGTELAARIGDEFPGVPVILMSEFGLRTPFDAAQLGELVSLALQHPVMPRADAPVPAV